MQHTGWLFTEFCCALLRKTSLAGKDLLCIPGVGKGTGVRILLLKVDKLVLWPLFALGFFPTPSPVADFVAVFQEHI